MSKTSNGIVPQKPHAAQPQQQSISFDIRHHIDRLIPAKSKNRYICPVCGSNNLTVDSKTGKYQCWSRCDCKDIREAISPWDEVKGKSDRRRQTRKPKAPTPAPIPEVPIELAKLPEYATHPEKRKRGDRTEIEYPYSNTQWVLRTEKPNPEKSKGYEKVTIPYHVNADGKSIKGKGDAAWNPYRIDEVQAYGAGKWALGVEGEPCTEAARYLGLVSFTLQGSDWTDADLTRAMLQCKSADVIGVVYFPDHDDTGYKKAQNMAAAAAKAQVPFIQLKPLALWSECPDKGDIADWVKWGMEQGWDKEEFVRQLEEQFNAAADAARDEQIAHAEQLALSIDVPDSFNPVEAFTQFTLNALYGDKPWICVDGVLYYWCDTHYKRSHDAVEINRISNWCNSYAVEVEGDNGEIELKYPYAKPSKVKEALEWVKMRLSVNPDLINPPGLNCTNGVLQIEWNVAESKPVPQWRITDHSPELYYTYEPLVKYDPEANSEACDRLLEVLDAPQRDIFLKTIAASLDLATIRQHKGRLVRGLLLKGHGSNGKDTLREAVSMMYGRQGMTGCTLSDFASYDEGRKFPLARLKHSRCNWASENANTTRLDKIQSLKAFITGDTLSAEGKGKDENEFAPTGIALFNVNDTPKLQGTLEAIASRYGVLSFNKTFKIGADPSKGELEADPRFKYDPNFLRSEVLPAFLNRVLDALQRLMVEGIDYSCTQKALEDIQAENSHLFQFCQDTGLGYDPNAFLTAGQIWERLEQWYLDNGTLTHEEDSKGKQKAIWSEQANPSDRNIKGANQVLARFQQLFPKCKRVTITHPTNGKKPIPALQGIGFLSGGNTPDEKCDNKLEVSTPVPTPISSVPTPVPTPVPTATLPQETTQNQEIQPSAYPTYPSFSIPDVKNENHLTDSGNVAQGLQKNSDTPQQLGWVGWKPQESSLPGVGTGVVIGVETAKTGVGEEVDVPIAPLAELAQAPTTAGGGLSPVTLEKDVVADVLLDEVSEEAEEAIARQTPVHRTEATSPDAPMQREQQPTPVEQSASTSADVAVLDAHKQQNLLDGTAAPTPDSTSIEPGDIVRFVNADNLPESRRFENLDLPVLRVLGDYLAYCQLPDGSEQSFGLSVLRKICLDEF